MRYKNFTAIALISIIALNLVFILSTFNNLPINKQVTTNSIAGVNLTVEQVCGDTYCNSPETCSTCAVDCGVCPGGGGEGAAPSVSSSGGGGGGGTTKLEVKPQLQNIEISQEIMKFTLKVGGSTSTGFSILNTGSQQTIVEITVSNSIENLISVDQQTISLQSKESKTIKVSVFAGENTQPGLYTGTIEITVGNIKKIIYITVEVESKKVLFDVSLDIPAKYKQVYPGSEIILNPTIFSLIDDPNPEAEITYLIKDFEGNIILELSEIIHMKDQITYTKTIKLPDNIKIGRYVVAIYVRYEKQSVAISSNIFDVISKEKAPSQLSNNILAIGTGIFILLLIIISSALYYEHLRLLNVEKSISKTIHETIKKVPTIHPINSDTKNHIHIEPKETSAMLTKLQRQMEVLKKSYGEGYITKQTYLKCKDRLSGAMNRFK